LLPDGKVDSNFAYNYYKSHYWDDFDFTDDRLIHTPIYDQKLDEFFNKLLIPTPDTVEHEADILLAKTRGRTELFKYTLHWITQWASNSKVMGLDEVFVYLVENYHMKGDAYWMDNETLNKYVDRARKIAPNVIGNIAPELKMKDVNGKEQSLHGVKAKYTLLVFWSPDCGHCITEIPKIDSLYKASLKKKGVKVYAVRTEGDEVKWKNFIKDHPGMEEWINVWDPEHHTDYQSQYDVYGTPSIYMLDEKKLIQGKKLDSENIAVLMNIMEIKEKKAAGTK
jgi:thiol-disulfide isomerase/thioredoxin